MVQQRVSRRRLSTDPDRLARVHRMQRRSDGTVSVRSVTKELGIGKDAARRLVQLAGLYREPVPRTGNDKQTS